MSPLRFHFLFLGVLFFSTHATQSYDFILFFLNPEEVQLKKKKKKMWHAWRPGQASYSPVPVTPKSFLFSSLPAPMTGPPLPAAPGTLSWSLWSRSSPDPPSLGLVLFSCHWLVCCCRCTARRLCSLCPWHFSWLSFLLLFFLNFLVDRKCGTKILKSQNLIMH